jgi:aspartyl-tRNA(Asn)/glutamyl-tRNA(Gln) amidotransferase subunit A
VTERDDLAFAPLASLSRQLRAHDLSPVELVELFLARLESLGPQLGCVAAVAAERARQSAASAATESGARRWRGPLHGIPFGLADAIDARGIPGTLGLPALAARVPERDATVAARLGEHGAILAAKLAVAPPVDPPASGAPAASCRSPWDPARAVGGPSPGTASAVAAGLLPFAVAALGPGPDLAAAECGVTALRTTYGVLSRRGAVLPSFTLATLGPVARSAEDCALVLDALAGADPRDPTSVGAPPAVGRIPLDLPAGLRIGVLDAAAATPEAQDAWTAAQESFRAAGALLAPVSLPDVPWRPLAELLASAEGEVVREDVLGVQGSGARTAQARATAADYVRAARARGEAQRSLARLLERHDLLLAPAPRGESDLLAAAVAIGGLPALTFPVGLAGGRPVTARLVAPPLEEARLLSTAALFQSGSTHHLQRPQLGPASPPVASVSR